MEKVRVDQDLGNICLNLLIKFGRKNMVAILKWMITPNDEFGGRTPLQTIDDGDAPLVRESLNASDETTDVDSKT